MDPGQEKELLERYTREQIENRNKGILFSISPPMLSAVVAGVQLALRHPSLRGDESPTAKLLQDFVACSIGYMRTEGLEASAAAAELGNDPQHDHVTAGRPH